jgi:hypothetical protein
MKKPIKKETTMDQLAAMVARGFETIERKMVTKDGLDTFKEETSENFRKVDENFTKVRRDILEIGDKYVSRDEFSKLVSRFNILEAKVKAKK